MNGRLALWLSRLGAALPPAQADWINELIREADHVPDDLRRTLFLWSGLQAAIGCWTRVRIGPQRLGQGLLAAALACLCLGGFAFSLNWQDAQMQGVLFGALGLYAIASVLAATHLKALQRYTLICSLALICAASVLTALQGSAPSPTYRFAQALALEQAALMAGLCIVASYLGWVERSDHA